MLVCVPLCPSLCSTDTSWNVRESQQTSHLEFQFLCFAFHFPVKVLPHLGAIGFSYLSWGPLDTAMVRSIVPLHQILQDRKKV